MVHDHFIDRLPDRMLWQYTLVQWNEDRIELLCGHGVVNHPGMCFEQAGKKD